MAHQVQDEGFHEIQLNGKQLVFLFMAATVVSVVIFLLGVLVGRGVHSVRGGLADTSPLGTVAEVAPQQPAPAPASTPPGSDPTAAAPPPAVDDLSYFNRLEKPSKSGEKLKPAPDGAAAASAPPVKVTEPPPSPAVPPPAPAPSVKVKEPAPPPATPTPAQAPPVSPVKEAPPSPAVTEGADAAPSSEPPGQGFAVQIAALNVRTDADAIAKRLSSKGYAAYVVSPSNGAPAVYRVRVGKFPTRREAETVAAKLQREGQFKPWVTR